MGRGLQRRGARVGARGGVSQCFAKSRQASWRSCGYSLGCRSNQSCLQRGGASQGRKSGKIFFGTAGGNKPACPTLTPNMVSTGAVREREGERQAPCCRGGAGTRGRALCPSRRGTPGWPSIQSHEMLVRVFVKIQWHGGKAYDKGDCGWRGDVQGDGAGAGGLFRRWCSLSCRVLRLSASRSPPG